MRRFIIILLAALSIESASAWSRAIHSAIAAIADDNLTEQAKSEISKALGGHTITYYAQWMYDVADSEGYTHTKNWRSVAFNKSKLISGKKIAKHSEDIVNRAQGLEALIAAVKAIEGGNLTEQQLADNIRYIVTIVGDLHCPTHYIFTDMLPQRKAFYYYNDKKYSYVSYWENNAVRGTFSWRTDEYVHQLSRKTPEQVAQITKGSITDWIVGNVPTYRGIYDLLESGSRFDRKTMRLWQNNIYPISTEQVAIAGYRLAAILNGLFDSSVENVKIK
ncbi:MAG: hypothetical protein IJX65_01435 [Alistipes sp.]|nr:hypothetical protein [Alistipes sp.]